MNLCEFRNFTVQQIHAHIILIGNIVYIFDLQLQIIIDKIIIKSRKLSNILYKL